MSKEQRDMTPPIPDWKRLGYPDEPTFLRIVEQHPEAAANAEGTDFRHFALVPGWIRLGWPSEALWRVAARTEAIMEATAQRAAGQRVRIPEPCAVSRVPWAEVLTMYPDRPGVPPHLQDSLRLVTLWPDSYRQPMVDVHLRVVITINDREYGGRERVPAGVAQVLRDADRRALDEKLKAMMPKTHPDRERVISALQGAS